MFRPGDRGEAFACITAAGVPRIAQLHKSRGLRADFRCWSRIAPVAALVSHAPEAHQFRPGQDPQVLREGRL